MSNSNEPELRELLRKPLHFLRGYLQQVKALMVWGWNVNGDASERAPHLAAAVWAATLRGVSLSEKCISDIIIHTDDLRIFSECRWVWKRTEILNFSQTPKQCRCCSYTDCSQDSDRVNRAISSSPWNSLMDNAVLERLEFSGMVKAMGTDSVQSEISCYIWRDAFNFSEWK